MSAIFSAGLFFLSYMPLWLAVVIIDSKSICEGNFNLLTEYISIIAIFLGTLISSVVVFVGLRAKYKKGIPKYEIRSFKETKMIVAEFMLSYILPLFVFDFTKASEVILFLVFFIMLGFLIIRHKYFSVNIVLELFNYRFYECKLDDDDGQEIIKIVMCQGEINRYMDEKVYFSSLNNEYELAFKVSNMKGRKQIRTKEIENQYKRFVLDKE